MLMLEMTCN